MLLVFMLVTLRVARHSYISNLVQATVQPPLCREALGYINLFPRPLPTPIPWFPNPPKHQHHVFGDCLSTYSRLCCQSLFIVFSSDLYRMIHIINSLLNLVLKKYLFLSVNRHASWDFMLTMYKLPFLSWLLGNSEINLVLNGSSSSTLGFWFNNLSFLNGVA